MTAAEIAEILGIALSTVSLWLRRLGLGKLASALSRRAASMRYERARPGELIHVDIKKLGRLRGGRPSGHSATALTAVLAAGWECRARRHR